MTKQDIKEPKRVLLVTCVLSMVIAVLITLIVGVCLGYMLAADLQTDAHAQALQSVQASKPQQ